MLFIRRARAGESTAEGEYVASYVDAMMDDKKEDGFATLSAIYLALKAYKEENPHITHAAVKTDGAGTPPPCTARGAAVVVPAQPATLTPRPHPAFGQVLTPASSARRGCHSWAS